MVIYDVAPCSMLGLLALICIIKSYSGVGVKILVPMVYRAGDFLFRHTV